MQALARESAISGVVGAIAMMPAGFVFRALEMRVGHYGPKFAALYLENPGPAALFIQHLVLGWISALPLCVLPLHRIPLLTVLIIGSLYGVVYYGAINSLALPIYFGDPLPWSFGPAVIFPSLMVHIIFGAAVAYTIYVLRQRRSPAQPALPADGPCAARSARR